ARIKRPRVVPGLLPEAKGVRRPIGNVADLETARLAQAEDRASAPEQDEVVRIARQPLSITHRFPPPDLGGALLPSDLRGRVRPWSMSRQGAPTWTSGLRGSWTGATSPTSG